MSPTPAVSFPGPAELGRGVVVGPGAPTPTGFEEAPRIVIDDAVLAHPQAVASLLHHHWLQRRRIVIELAADNAQARAPEVINLPPYSLPADTDLHRERLHAMTWANTYDLRSGEPIWWHGELAQRHTAATAPETPDQTPAARTTCDVRLPDGRPAWIDGGPRGPLARPLPVADAAALIHRESIALRRLTELSDDPPVHATDLAPDQLDAVLHRSGPARVIAPAGSGKTRVLTARLRHLLADRGVEPELVTAVAYNTRAASEMRSRTQDLRASIRTLHSLALWICNLDVRREVIQERDVRAILDRLVRTARIPNQDPYQPYLEALGEVRLALRDPIEVEAARGDVDGFAEMFDAYREELDRRGVLDFDEQIYRAIELLLTRPDIRATAQRAGTHMLVDEFQDLTPAFMLLVRLVAGPTAQVFAVGDDDQTIYSYAGATPRYLVDVQRWFPGAEPHALEVNYRCPAPVVDAAVKLLSHNRVRVRKTIRSHIEAAGPDAASGETATPPVAQAMVIERVPSTQMATTAVAGITALLDGGAAPGDIAVLARVNSALLPIQVALTEAGTPHTAPLDGKTLGRTGVRTALAYLRLGLDLDRISRDDLMDTINRPARKVKSAITPLLQGNRFSISQLESISASLGETHKERYNAYLLDLRLLERAITDGADTSECLRIIRDRIGLGEAMDALDSSRTRPEGSSHADDLDALAQLASLQPDPGSFREWLADRLKVPGDETGVTLSTVHRVKGMEWDHVVVFAANGGLFPHRLADDTEEERRVLHVAVTRCRTQVTVVADQDRPSPFLAELHTATDRDVPEQDGEAAVALPAAKAATRGADGTVAAEVGTALGLIGGLQGRIVEADPDGASIRLLGGRAEVAGDSGEAANDSEVTDLGVTVRLPFGSTVLVDDQQTTLVRRRRASPATRAGDGRLLADEEASEPVDEELFEALRGWRARIAAETGVPAYLVFHDRHLRLIAGRKPASVRELAGCPGVGPTKLERYADDVLDLVDQHR